MHFALRTDLRSHNEVTRAKVAQGEVAEWLKAHVLKTVRGRKPYRGFESHPLRQASHSGRRTTSHKIEEIRLKTASFRCTSFHVLAMYGKMLRGYLRG